MTTKIELEKMRFYAYHGVRATSERTDSSVERLRARTERT